MDVRQRELDEQAREHQLQANISGAGKWRAAQAQAWLAQLPPRRANIRQAVEGEMALCQGDVARAALLAGDAVVYTMAQLEMLRFQALLTNDANLVTTLEQMAEDLPMLAGARQSAATLLMRARAMRMAAAATPQRQQLLKQAFEGPLPAWWPPHVPDVLGQTDFGAMELRAVEQELRQEVALPATRPATRSADE
jgi:hypothetical protein